MDNEKVRKIDMAIESMSKRGKKTTDTVSEVLNDKTKFRIITSASNIQNTGLLRMYLQRRVAAM